MFSQQHMKRMNQPNANLTYNTNYNNNGMQNTQANIAYSDFNMPYQNFNDNMSIYSSNSTSNSSNFRRRSPTEEFNAILSSCIEEFLPKIAEECAESVYAKISKELDRQSKEIEELKNQLETLKAFPSGSYTNRLNNKNATPMKKIKKINENIRKVNTMLTNQSETIKESFQNQNPSTNQFFESLQEKLGQLQETIEEEKRAAEMLNLNMKDRYVDLLGMKNFLDEKVDYLINDIKLNNGNENCETRVYNEIIESIDNLLIDITSNGNKTTKNFYNNLEIEQMDVMNQPGLAFNNENCGSNGIITGNNNITNINMNTNRDFLMPGSKDRPIPIVNNMPVNNSILLSTPVTMPNNNGKGKKNNNKFSSFNKFSF